MSGESSRRPGVLTVPNLVSVGRILMVGVFWWLVAEDLPAAAAWLLIVMAGTDWLDGWLARRLGQVTDLGAMLDPLGDSLMMASAVVAGMIKAWVPVAVGTVLLVRFAVVAAWSLWVTGRAREAITVRMSGKVAITLLFIAMPAFYFADGSAGAVGSAFEVLGWLTAVVGLGFYWWSGVHYLRDGLGVLRDRRRRDADS